MRKKEEDITQQLCQPVNLSNSIKIHTNPINLVKVEIHHCNKKLCHKNWMNGQHTVNK